MTQKEGMLYQNAYPLFCCKRLSGGSVFLALVVGPGGFGSLLGLLGGFQRGHFLGGGFGVAGLHLGFRGLGLVVVVRCGPPP